MSQPALAPTPRSPASGWRALIAASAQAIRRASPIHALSRSSLRQNLAKAAGAFEPERFDFCLSALTLESREAGVPFKAPEALDAALAFAGPLGLSYARALLAAGANPELGGFTPPIHFAVGLRDPDFLLALIGAGADLNQRDAHGQTPLIRAAANGLLEPAKLLIDAGCDLNALDSKGRCALHAALANAAAVPLISHPASSASSLSHADAESNRCLLRRQQGMLLCVRALLDAGADSNAGHHPGSPISIALELNERELAHRLLDLSNDPAGWLRSELARLTARTHWSNEPYVKAPEGCEALLQELWNRARALGEGLSIQSALDPASPPGVCLEKSASAPRPRPKRL